MRNNLVLTGDGKGRLRLLPGVEHSLTKCVVTEHLVCTLNTDGTKEAKLFPTSEALQIKN